MSLSLSQLDAFRTAAHSGSFTAAAHELHMSQPAVSDLVRRLEGEVGSTLFVRGSRRLELTSAGRHLLPHAERALDAVDAGRHAVQALRNVTGGTASFGVLRNANLYLSDGLARKFHDRHPDVRIRLVGQNSAETAEDVRAGRLEAGLVTLPVDGTDLDSLPVARDEVVYVTADHRRARNPPTIEELCERPLVLYDAHFAQTDPMRRQLNERSQLAGGRIDAAIEVEYLGSALDLVAAGIGDTFAPRGALTTEIRPRGLRATPLAEPLFDTIALVRRRGRPVSPATFEFARLALAALVEHSSDAHSTVELLDPATSLEAFLI